MTNYKGRDRYKAREYLAETQGNEVLDDGTPTGRLDDADEVGEATEALREAIRTCFRILDWTHPAAKYQEAMGRVGAEPALLIPHYLSRGVNINVPQRLSFSQEVITYIELLLVGHNGRPADAVEVTVRWASGGGPVAKSLAQVALIRDAVEKAAQCELALRERLRTFGEDELVKAIATLAKEKEEQWAKVRAYLGLEGGE